MFEKLLPDWNQFNYNEVYETLVKYGLKVIYAAIILFVGLKIIKWFNGRINKRLDKAKIDTSLKSFLTPLINIALKIALLLSIINMLGIETTSFIAILGSLAFAIGLALQGSLANFAGGVLILILKPYKIGDYIEAQGFSGTVKDIQIFYTVLATIDNKKIVIPNSNLSNSSLINYSTYPTRRLELKVSCSYDNNVLHVKEVLEKLIKSQEKILIKPEPIVVLGEYGESSIQFIARGWVKTSEYWDTYNGLMLKVKGVFDENGIKIPYPQMDVHLFKQKEL